MRGAGLAVALLALLAGPGGHAQPRGGESPVGDGGRCRPTDLPAPAPAPAPIAESVAAAADAEKGSKVAAKLGPGLCSPSVEAKFGTRKLTLPWHPPNEGLWPCSSKPLSHAFCLPSQQWRPVLDACAGEPPSWPAVPQRLRGAVFHGTRHTPLWHCVTTRVAREAAMGPPIQRQRLRPAASKPG